MTQETKTHWRKNIDQRYLGSYSFPEGKDVILTISDVKTEEITGNANKKTKCNLVYFKEQEKPMVLNRTNSKQIQKLYNTPYLEDWVGKKIQLYITKVAAFGDTTDALRIRDFKPESQKIDNSRAIEKLKGSTSLKDLAFDYASLNKDEKADPEVLKLKEQLKLTLK